jgi:threonine aldolase
MIEAMVRAASERAYFELREDPRQRDLEAQMAELLGHEDSLLFPTCTMANEVALQLLTRPGDVVATPPGAHLVTSEANAPAVLSGVRVEFLDGDMPMPSIDVWTRAAKREGGTQKPPVSTFAIENTHNRAGGAVVDAASTQALAELAHEHGKKLHIDGARLFCAAVAQDTAPSELARHADTVSISLNKTLGAPGGAMLVASKALIDRALVLRHRLGGGFRPTGILAAAALEAISDWPSLHIDNERAQRLANGLVRLDGIGVIAPATNLVMILIRKPGLTPRMLCDNLAANGVLALPFGEDRIRMAIYREIDEDAVDRTISAVEKSLTVNVELDY